MCANHNEAEQNHGVRFRSTEYGFIISMALERLVLNSNIGTYLKVANLHSFIDIDRGLQIRTKCHLNSLILLQVS